MKSYLCIDLKSFYASVECVERGLDPFKVSLVVADKTRGDGAITLAATPRIKEFGVKSRGRLFEIPKNIEYMIAPPRMHLYMEYAAKIYKIFMKYVSSEDIHVYSIDESFLDVTQYLKLYKCDAKTLAKRILTSIFNETGITATCGIGPNLYLCKIALDIFAKHEPDNIAFLNQDLYKQLLWHHKPLTDFWMVGPGYQRRLVKLGIDDMYGVAHINPKVLYDTFGINAEYLIDHAVGEEPVTIKDIKNYHSHGNSMSNSQILFSDYNYDDAFLVLKEMVEVNVLNLSDNHLVTNNISLYVGYSKDVVKPSCGSLTMLNTTNNYRLILNEFSKLFKKIVNHNIPIRQIAVSFNNVCDEYYEQYNLFVDQEEILKDKKIQNTINEIKHKFGKNACLKGMNLLPNATTKKRNTLIGGHNE